VTFFSIQGDSDAAVLTPSTPANVQVSCPPGCLPHPAPLHGFYQSLCTLNQFPPHCHPFHPSWGSPQTHPLSQNFEKSLHHPESTSFESHNCTAWEESHRAGIVVSLAEEDTEAQNKVGIQRHTEVDGGAGERARAPGDPVTELEPIGAGETSLSYPLTGAASCKKPNGQCCDQSSLRTAPFMDLLCVTLGLSLLP
jgi:hypothetical protein